MKFKVKRQSVKQESVEVELPCYSRHDLEFSTLYRKLIADENGDLFLFTIDTQVDRIELSMEQLLGPDLGINGDYYLGEGEYKSSEKEWLSAFAHAEAMMDKWRRWGK